MISTVILSIVMMLLVEGNTNCETRVKEVSIMKTVVRERAGIQTTFNCIGQTNATACEGHCVSSITPSVNDQSGFDKVRKLLLVY